VQLQEAQRRDTMSNHPRSYLQTPAALDGHLLVCDSSVIVATALMILEWSSILGHDSHKLRAGILLGSRTSSVTTSRGRMQLVLRTAGTATVPDGYRASANRGTSAYSIGVVDKFSAV
jgi:hypothetical protein